MKMQPFIYGRVTEADILRCPGTRGQWQENQYSLIVFTYLGIEVFETAKKGRFKSDF